MAAGKHSAESQCYCRNRKKTTSFKLGEGDGTQTGSRVTDARLSMLLDLSLLSSTPPVIMEEGQRRDLFNALMSQDELTLISFTSQRQTINRKLVN